MTEPTKEFAATGKPAGDEKILEAAREILVQAQASGATSPNQTTTSSTATADPQPVTEDGLPTIHLTLPPIQVTGASDTNRILLEMRETGFSIQTALPPAGTNVATAETSLKTTGLKINKQVVVPTTPKN